jgi:demethylmenaquinone methyltransferase/2-methoxy-6-polyprenyl-1,4-benzoquinol methylase
MTTNSDDPKKTHFGFTNIPLAEKAKRVAEVFSSVAGNYDLMNDLMSFGLHRLWKRFTISAAHVQPGQTILDIAGGTGDLTRAFATKVGPAGRVILADINAEMLNQGRDRLTDAGIINNISFVQANAEQLPFPNNSFDLITIAFGLRNVTDKQAALASMYRVLKPGGKLLVLEFSKPILPILGQLYDKYSFKMIPLLGKWISNDAASYQYLVESIRMHPDQTTLASMLQTAEFEDVDFHNLSGGIVALHKGFKY